MQRCYVIFLSLIPCLLFAQISTPKFRHLTSTEGLSQDHVSAILKDYKGFMWFATDEGLNRYDGYKFTVYKHDPERTQSISGNVVIDIYEDESKNLWVGTINGLDRFDRAKETFIHYKPDSANISVRDIFQDSEKRFWIGTTYGLYLFSPELNKFKSYRHEVANENSLSNDFIYRIAEDKKDELWIATRAGANRFDVKEQKFYRYKYDARDKKSIGTNRIKAVYKSSAGDIWFGTQGAGIARYNRKEDSFTRYENNPHDKTSISHNDILCITEDKHGVLWIGTENGGISLFDKKTDTFTNYQHDVTDNASLSNNSVYSLYRDDINNMWVGTFAGGVNLVPNSGDKFEHFKKIPGNENSLSSDLVLSINGDDDGNIWVGTDGGGIDRINWKTKSFTHFQKDLSKENGPSSNHALYITNISKDILAVGYHRSGFDFLNRKTGQFIHHMPKNGVSDLSGLSVHVVFADKSDHIWIGSYDRNGLYQIGANDVKQPKTKDDNYIHYPFDPGSKSSIGGSIVYCLYEDKEGNLWIGTNGGLDLFDKKNDKFIHHRYDPKNKNSLSNNVVYSITEAPDGNLWIGTGGGGLNFFDKKNQTFTSYTVKDGLPNDIVYGILQDAHGNLWFSTNNGLSRFNPSTKICRNFGISDGLQGNSFKPNAYYKAKTGEMFFGGANGFNVFHPDSIKDNSFIPPVWITGMQIFNKPVEVGPDSPLKNQISDLSSIQLSYEQSVFTFEFAALNYSSPEKNQYAYKLEGFDENWNYVGNNRTATYTNLDPGEYTFKVKGSNNDGVWNTKSTTLKLTITPPFWKTIWFRSLVVLTLIYAILFFYRTRISIIQKQKAKLKKKVKKRTQRIMKMNEEINRQADEIKAINENLEQLVRSRTIELERKNKALKEYAFINAHKVRGPLASILGLIDLISRIDLPPENDEMMEHLRQSAENLDTIVRSIAKMIEDQESVGREEKNPF